ncbi:hypothetical protein ACS0TY_012217 [Phlomoides rotata]
MDPVNMPTTRVHWIRASNALTEAHSIVCMYAYVICLTQGGIAGFDIFAAIRDLQQLLSHQVIVDKQ